MDALDLKVRIAELEAENAVLLQQFDAATQAYQAENERLLKRLRALMDKWQTYDSGDSFTCASELLDALSEEPT